MSVTQAVEQLRHLPFENLGFAKIDHHRGLRQGFAEVVYGRGKTPHQVTRIVRGLLRAPATNNILITRADEPTYHAMRRLSRNMRFHALSGAISIRRNRTISGKGTILVITAGTSDIPVAEEAVITAETMGNRVESVYDVGVAGLHRLLRYREKLAAARVMYVHGFIQYETMKETHTTRFCFKLPPKDYALGTTMFAACESVNSAD
jgi:pyridinium-3,5-biscarboxylic acid mononucleotide synthase